MLYVTTRNNTDVFTAQRVLSESRGDDGGMFLPFHMPSFSEEEIKEFTQLSFNQCAARILNLLFRKQLTAWDLDFEIGRYPVRIHSLGQKMLIGECWHNPQWNMRRTTLRIIKLLNDGKDCASGDWTEIAAGIAVLFGMYSELVRNGHIEAGEKIDFSCVGGELTNCMCAWYARQWGLPIGNIIVCCNENSEIWNLICHGQLRTDTLAVSTLTPDADVAIPRGLERLIFACGGQSEVCRYLESCRRGEIYAPSDMVLTKIREGLFISVVSSQRIQNTVPAAYATHRYLMSPYTALSYAGLLDYRAKKGTLRSTIILAERSPLYDDVLTASALGVEPDTLKKYME